MTRDSFIFKVLYRIAGYASQFYAEGTREWAEKTVEKLEKRDSDLILKKDDEEVMREVSKGGTMFYNRSDKITVFGDNERDRGLTPIVLAMKHRIPRYFAIISIVTLFSAIRLYEGQPVPLRSIGIYSDLFGAVIVVRGLYRSPPEINYQSKSVISGSPVGDPVTKLVVAVETVDAMFGSAFLVAGFSIQLFVIVGLFPTFLALLLTVLLWGAIT